MGDSTQLSAIIRSEQDAVAIETRIAGCPPIVAVNQLEEVLQVPGKLRWNHKATLKSLPGAKGHTFVVDCASLKSKALWTGTSNNAYRNDYLVFLNAEYQLGITAIPAAYDVDHLYNRSRAAQYGLQFLRLALVEAGPNRSHGGAYEKDLTTNEALRGSRSGIKLMDAISSMKYWGFLSPLRDDPRETEIQAYLAFAASKLGLDPKEERESIMYLRQKASTPWARKNT